MRDERFLRAFGRRWRVGFTCGCGRQPRSKPGSDACRGGVAVGFGAAGGVSSAPSGGALAPASCPAPASGGGAAPGCRSDVQFRLALARPDSTSCAAVVTDVSMSLAADCTSLLQLAQLLELQLAVDVGLDVGDVALQPAEEVPQRARRLRQLLGPDDDQRHDGDDDDFGKRCRTCWSAKTGDGGRRGRLAAPAPKRVLQRLFLLDLALDRRARRASAAAPAPPSPRRPRSRRPSCLP